MSLKKQAEKREAEKPEPIRLTVAPNQFVLEKLEVRYTPGTNVPNAITIAGAMCHNDIPMAHTNVQVLAAGDNENEQRLIKLISEAGVLAAELFMEFVLAGAELGKRYG
jgi:hypothetical protein